MGFPGDSVVKNLSAKQESGVPSLGWEEPLEKAPIFLPKYSYGQRSMAVREVTEESDTTQQLKNNNYIYLSLSLTHICLPTYHMFIYLLSICITYLSTYLLSIHLSISHMVGASQVAQW